jgi:ectoine hydroxylase-related dioxygenase (phytanoyl-CoA dioxygenase family)
MNDSQASALPKTQAGRDKNADFERDGAVVVRGAFSSDWIELAREAIDANLADLSPHAKRASTTDDGAFVEDFCSWARLPALERFIRESPAAEIAAGLMGSATVRLYHDHVLVKEPGTRQRTPWHQDQPYYNVDGRQNVSMWMPVDAVPRESTLEFVAGSHLGPWYMPRSFLDGEAKWFAPGQLAELPDIDGDPERFGILGWELEPGDAVFFNMLTLHASGGSAKRRRVLSVRFLGDDMVHAPRPWATSPPFPGLEDELPAGAPMDHPLFPVLWSGHDSVRVSLPIPGVETPENHRGVGG